jgi:hypothetical protein
LTACGDSKGDAKSAKATAKRKCIFFLFPYLSTSLLKRKGKKKCANEFVMMNFKVKDIQIVFMLFCLYINGFSASFGFCALLYSFS